MVDEKTPEEVNSLEEIFFERGLYSPMKLPSDKFLASDLYCQTSPVRIDGHCPYCNKVSTFTLHQDLSSNGFERIATRFAYDEAYLECIRNQDHRIWYYWRIKSMTIEKIGQYPSLATITNSELSKYRKFMSKEDANEFFKATGLAAHGVGIGSFVYLRRVFERLIYKRFAEFKEVEGWTDQQFSKLRMAEKIVFLKDHLPDFLVQNAKIYSILSIGIHSLNEEKCAGFFEVIKDSIVVILEDDLKKKEELDRRSRLGKAIAGVDLDAIEALVETGD
ncbi:hypothetical protein [Kaistia defluvii]|uniref:Uncharacterized protein n=1 Tax=Kaistia defluvii TaxID=410841 RepID=A0ABV2QU33_9HYPH